MYVHVLVSRFVDRRVSVCMYMYVCICMNVYVYVYMKYVTYTFTYPFIQILKMSNLTKASKEGNLNEVKDLISKGANVNNKDDGVMKTLTLYIICVLFISHICGLHRVRLPFIGLFLGIILR